MTIKNILKSKKTELITIRDQDTVETAAQLLASKRIGALPVRDANGVLVGILSERDIVRGMAEKGGQVASAVVSSLMTTKVLTISPDMPVKEALEIMNGKRIRHLPVVENGTPVDMLSIGDVVAERLAQSEMEKGVLRDFALLKA